MIEMTEEGEKKGSVTVKIGLGVSVAILTVSLIANVWLYANYASYTETHSYTDPEYDNLDSSYNNYKASHSHTNSEYDALEAERDALRAPKLSELNFFIDDVRPWWSDPYLLLHGEVWNVGTDTAENVMIHVMAYQGQVRVIDTYVELGTVYGESKVNVDARIYYSGGALTHWNAEFSIGD